MTRLFILLFVGLRLRCGVVLAGGGFSRIGDVGVEGFLSWNYFLLFFFGVYLWVSRLYKKNLEISFIYQ